MFYQHVTSPLNLIQKERCRVDIPRWQRQSISQITDYLFLSDWEAACNRLLLQKLNITHVISIMEEEDMPNYDRVTSVERTLSVPEAPANEWLKLPSLEETKDVKETKEYDEAEAAKDGLEETCVTHLKLCIADTERARIRRYFQTAYEFILQARKGQKRVLVHCAAGISRSPTIVTAFLMQFYKLKFVDALRYVKSRRSCVFPNEGFSKQLEMFGIEMRYNRRNRRKLQSILFRTCYFYYLHIVNLIQEYIVLSGFR